MRMQRAPDDDGFVVMPNETTWDARVSWKAKGILLYCLTRKPGWVFYATEIEKHATEGRDAVRAGLRELIEHGYIVRERLRGEDGKLQGWSYLVYKRPHSLPPEELESRDLPQDHEPTINGKAVYGESDATNGFAGYGFPGAGKSALSTMDSESACNACMHGPGSAETPSTRDGCVLPDAACMHAPPTPAPDATPTSDDWRAEGAGRLRGVFGYQAGLAAKLAAKCPTPAYLDAWIRRAEYLAAEEGVPVRTKSGLLMKGIQAGEEAPWVPDEPAECGAKGGAVRTAPVRERERQIDRHYEEAAAETRRQVAELRREPDPDTQAEIDAELAAVKARMAAEWGIAPRRSAP